MQITTNMKMADLIHLNYTLLPILNRFGIQLGFGEKTVDELCNQLNINSDFFLEIINAFNDADYFPADNLQKFPIELLIEYLKSTHKYYLENKVLKIKSYIAEMIKLATPEQLKKLNLVSNFLDEYINELHTHINREENIIYPYILDICNYVTNNELSKINKQDLIKKSKIVFAEEHGNIEEKLYDLKNIIIKYVPTVDNNLSNMLLIELFRLEKDLNNHQRIEDKVMYPKVKEIEKQILQ